METDPPSDPGPPGPPPAKVAPAGAPSPTAPEFLVFAPPTPTTTTTRGGDAAPPPAPGPFRLVLTRAEVESAVLDVRLHVRWGGGGSAEGDLIQAVFEAYYSGLRSGTLDPAISPADHLKKLVRQACRKRRRKLVEEKVRAGLLEQEALAEAGGHDEEEAIEVRDELARVNELLGTMAGRPREALLLRICGELTVAEIAAKLGASEETVRQWLYRARVALREGLGLGAATVEPGEELPLPASTRRALKTITSPPPLARKERAGLAKRLGAIAGLPAPWTTRRPVKVFAGASLALAVGLVVVWFRFGQRALPFVPPPPPTWPGVAAPPRPVVRYCMTSCPEDVPPPPKP